MTPMYSAFPLGARMSSEDCVNVENGWRQSVSAKVMYRQPPHTLKDAYQRGLVNDLGADCFRTLVEPVLHSGL